MAKTARTGYSALQIGLHWTVALLIVLQFLAHESIVNAWDAYQDGEVLATPPLTYLHIAVGLTILVLAIWRLVLRFTRGVPPLPANEPAPLKFLAHATHFGIYALIIGMPIGGAVAWFLGVEQAAEGHSLAFNALLVLGVVHVVGALFQQFVLKTTVLARMAAAED
jgi:cytochrome b561